MTYFKENLQLQRDKDFGLSKFLINQPINNRLISRKFPAVKSRN